MNKVIIFCCVILSFLKRNERIFHCILVLLFYRTDRKTPKINNKNRTHKTNSISSVWLYMGVCM